MEEDRRIYDNRDVISLFSGAMGLDIGLQKAGLNVKIGQDFDAICVETMRARYRLRRIPSVVILGKVFEAVVKKSAGHRGLKVDWILSSGSSSAYISVRLKLEPHASSFPT